MNALVCYIILVNWYSKFDKKTNKCNINQFKISNHITHDSKDAFNFGRVYFASSTS